MNISINRGQTLSLGQSNKNNKHDGVGHRTKRLVKAELSEGVRLGQPFSRNRPRPGRRVIGLLETLSWNFSGKAVLKELLIDEVGRRDNDGDTHEGEQRDQIESYRLQTVNRSMLQRNGPYCIIPESATT